MLVTQKVDPMVSSFHHSLTCLIQGRMVCGFVGAAGEEGGEAVLFRLGIEILL